MEKSNPTMKIFDDIWEQCTQKFVLRLSATIKSGLKEVIEKDHTTVNQAIWDLDLKMTSYKNDCRKRRGRTWTQSQKRNQPRIITFSQAVQAQLFLNSINSYLVAISDDDQLTRFLCLGMNNKST